MPLPKDVVTMLAKGELKDPYCPAPSYFDKLPVLGENIFPNDIKIWDLAVTGTENGQKLRGILKEAGLTKGQLTGFAIILDCFTMIGDCELTVGDIRALSLDELKRLQPKFSYSTPAIESITKIKRLFG